MNNVLSIVVPVYFNEESLPLLFERLNNLEENLRRAKIDLELIFVDDGSDDNSFQELERIKSLRPATKIVKLVRNFGVVKASKCGLSQATGDCFTVLSADLQDPPELLLEMVQRWRDGALLTICVRSSRDDPILSKIFSSIYYWLLRKMVMKEFPAGGFDMFLLDSSLQEYVVNSAKSTYTPLLVAWLGTKPEVINYHRQKREFGKSRWTLPKKIRAFLDVMLGFSLSPLRLISSIGVFASFLSFAYALIIIVSSVLGQSTVPGFATIVCLVSFLVGIVIIMLGIIGEYLGRIFDEINKRPDVVIEKIL